MLQTLLKITLLIAAIATPHANGAKEKPNLIVILADDMGYSDPGCYGGEIATPAIDKMAKEGMRFSRFTNGGMCVVSRASMLTGKWWPRALPEFKKTQILPEHLQESGYRTALIGKWHLQGNPMDRGFDHFFGFLGGFADHFEGAKDYRLDRKPFKDFGQNFYSSDDFTDRAIDFITTPQEKSKPFFLYLSFQAPHNPLQAPMEDIMKYRGKYLKGWQAIREERFTRQKKLGLLPPDTRLPDYPQNLPDWDSLSPAQKDLEDLRMSVYAAMIERMDKGIGRVMDALRKSGQADNTLILFLSDNGADSFSVVDKEMLKQDKLPGDPGSNWQPGTGWAYASVTPWRLYKISQHRGGITTGAVAWWAGTYRSGNGIQNSPLHIADIMPTFLEAAGAKIPDETAGESFLHILTGNEWKLRKPMFYQYVDNRAIRTDSWTLAEVDGNGWELFDNYRDILENNNVAKKHPEIVATLSKKWLDWWKTEGKKNAYKPVSSKESPHYRPQGDRGSGEKYVPSAMPHRLADRLPVKR